MPPRAVGMPATIFAFEDRLRIVAGSHVAEHARRQPGALPARLPEHRATKLAAVQSGFEALFEQRATLYTTNKQQRRWGDVLHDNDLAETLVDRILERGRILHLDGPSMRTRHLTPEDAADLGGDKHERSRIPGTSGAEYPELAAPGPRPRVEGTLTLENEGAGDDDVLVLLQSASAGTVDVTVTRMDCDSRGAGTEDCPCRAETAHCDPGLACIDAMCRPCPTGTLGCACYGNDTCDDELACAAGECVSVDCPRRRSARRTIGT